MLVATDFFISEVWTLGGLVTYYVLFLIHLGSRKVEIAGMTPHPNAAWMMQMARNVTILRPNYPQGRETRPSIYVTISLGGDSTLTPTAICAALDPDLGWLIRARQHGTWRKVADLIVRREKT